MSALTKTDIWLDRISKIAAILVPVILTVYAQVYTVNKDRSDRKLADAQSKRETDQRQFEIASRRYQNLTALAPLFTSADERTVLTAIEIFDSEAKSGQAPLDLRGTVKRIRDNITNPTIRRAASEALKAAEGQVVRDRCTQQPEGVYVHVANSAEPGAARDLARALASLDVPVQGVERRDETPRHTEIRYYFSEDTNKFAASLEAKLRQFNLPSQQIDLSQKYLGKDCPPPRIYEVWIGADDKI